MNRRFVQFLQFTLGGLDLLILNAIYLLYRFIFEGKIFFESKYFIFWIILNLCWMVLSWIGKVYSPNNILSFELFTKQTMRIYVIWILCLFFYIFISHEIILSRLFVICCSVTFAVGLLLNRFAYIGIRGYFRNSDNF